MPAPARMSRCFASAHPIRIASMLLRNLTLLLMLCLSTPHTDCITTTWEAVKQLVLCLSTPHTDCIGNHPRNSIFLMCFASAHPIRIASPIRARCFHLTSLCLSTPHTDCIAVKGFTTAIHGIFASAHPIRIASLMHTPRR